MCEKPEHPINFQINAACLLIKDHKCYSELSVGWSGFLLTVSKAFELLLNPVPVSRTRLLLDPELARWLVRLSGDDGVVSYLKTAVLQMGFPGGANGKELCRRHK